MSTRTCRIETLEGRTFLSGGGPGVVDETASPAALAPPPDAAPNTMKRARNLGVMSEPRAIAGWVGDRNLHDYFRLRLEQRDELKIDLSGLSQAASVELLNAKGKVLAAGRGNV